MPNQELQSGFKEKIQAFIDLKETTIEGLNGLSEDINTDEDIRKIKEAFDTIISRAIAYYKEISGNWGDIFD